MKKIEQKVIKLVDENKLIDRNDKVLVALSGGPDSVFLLYLLKKFKRRFNLSVGAIHVNHKIRGNAADEDERFCSKLCSDLNIEFFACSADVKEYALQNKISIEEAGRIIRYKKFEEYSFKYGYTKIATAHNSGDNAETVLLNLIKGTGLKGVAGIPLKRGNIIRPVLNLSKAEITKYLEENRIGYRIDSTNAENEFQRNYIRNKIIPLIKDRLNPQIEETLFNSSEIFRNILFLTEKKINRYLSSVIKFIDNKLYISILKLSEIEKELRGEIIKASLERNFSIQISFNDVKKVIFLLESEAGKKVQLSNSLSAVRERDNITIFKNVITQEFPAVRIETGERIKINGKYLVIEPVDKMPESYTGKGSIEYISADGLDDNFVLRRWRPGDRFYPLGMKGSKKLSDFLTEQKIEPTLKNKQLVLTNNERIVWVVGLRLDNRFKIQKNTKKVISLCLK